MKIYMVGNFTAPWCSEVHWAKSLEKLGHTVTRKQENTVRPGAIPREITGHDLFLWVRTWPNYVTEQDIVQVRQMGIPSVNVHLDLFVGISREDTLKTDPRWKTDFVFTADGSPESQKVFEKHGINHHWLRAGVFDEGCKMFKPNNHPELQGDVVFVGGGKEYAHPEWPYRKQLIEFLEQNYPEGYRKYGHPQKLVREDDLNQLYANAKIVIGDSLNLGFDHENYWSDRVYETIGRGGFIIHPDIKGLEKDFKYGKEIVVYEHGNLEDLKEKIDYYLKNDKEREKIRKAGFKRVKKEHTYVDRMKEMLEIVKENTVMPEDKTIINLGAGNDTDNTYINVDRVKTDGVDVVHNLIHFPWPFEDESADGIRAIDIIEHLPPYIGEDSGVIRFIEECHRILKPGGELYIQTPGWRAEFLWIDPTHVRGFDIQSMDFFDPTKHYGQRSGYYSECKFSVRAEELANHNIRFWMKKI